MTVAMKKTLALLLLLAGLSVEAQGELLNWNGGEDKMFWDKVSKNWLDQNGQAVSYQDGYWVNFYDSGSGIVMLPELLEPSEVDVDNSVGHDYTFVSIGGLTGKMMLIKYGEGKLTIKTSNDYTGDTIISKGTIVVGDKMALGRSRIVMSNYSGGLPTLDLGKYSISNSVVVEHGYASIGNGTLSRDLTLEKKSHLTLLENTTITGNISLGDGATFNLADNSVTGAVTLAGSATIGNGTINGNMAVAEGKSLALLEHTTVTGGVSLGAQSSLNLGGNTFHTGGEGGSQVTFSGDATVSNGTLVLDSDWSPGYALTFTDITLDLNKHTLSQAVSLKGNNTIGNGTLNTNLNVGEGDTLTLCGNLDGQQYHDDKITLGNNATLDLNNHSLSKYCHVRINGDAFIGNGSFYSEVVVEEGKKLTLCGNLWDGDSIVLRNNATLDLNNHSYAGTIYCLAYDESRTISATIGNGTLDCYLNVGRENTLNLCGNLSGSGFINMNDSSTLNLNNHTLSKDVTLDGTSASIGNGAIESNLLVGSGKTLSLSGNLGGSGIITLGDKATLDLGGHALANNVIVDGSNTTITGGGGSIKGDITVQTGKSLKLDGTLMGSVDVTLGANSSLDLGSQDRYCSVTVIGNNAAILNGKLELNMYIAENVDFTLSQNSAEISGTIFLKGNNTLDLGGKTVDSINLFGKSATIGKGTVDNDISMGDDTILTLSGDISIKDGIRIDGSNNTVNLNGHTLTGRVTTHQGNNNIGNGTIAGNVIVNRGSRIHLYGETHFKGGTMTFENDPTTVKALDPATPGLLKELTVSKGLIAGTDRQSSLADGLDISRMGYDLELKNLVLTANNSISVGNGKTITLNNVTIKLSQPHYDETEGVFLFDLGTLINCDLVMENVLLDASNLSLPEGFDPANKSVVFDFGDDVTIKQATGLDMRLGNYWSPSLNLDEQGQVIFTKLVDTPEPTTGVLSLLGLGLLAGRRRRR